MDAGVGVGVDVGAGINVGVGASVVVCICFKLVSVMVPCSPCSHHSNLRCVSSMVSNKSLTIGIWTKLVDI